MCCTRGLGARHLVCGPDFAFGRRRGGGTDFLARRAEALGMGLTLVPLLADGAGPISATRIRRVLQDGYPERATADLGPALDDPRRGGAWRRARADDRLPHRQHRAGPPSGAGARGLCGDGAAAGRAAGAAASRTSAAGRR